MSDKHKQRLDQRILALGLAPTRSRARDAILRGCVSVDGAIADKPGLIVGAEAEIRLDADAVPYVSRGGLKLAAALDAFGFDPAGRAVLDIGASTGGFTDCLLQRGAARVFSVDIGKDQLHADLRERPEVTVMEGRDARQLQAQDFGRPIEALTADVSFISLALVLPKPLQLAAPGAWLVALVKPQFELGPKALGKGGIVKDDLDRQLALARIREFLSFEAGWQIAGEIESPIAGGSGNREFLIGAVKAR